MLVQPPRQCKCSVFVSGFCNRPCLLQAWARPLATGAFVHAASGVRGRPEQVCPTPAPLSLRGSASASRAGHALECSQSRGVGEQLNATGAYGQASQHVFRSSQRQQHRPVGQRVVGQFRGQQERGHQFKGRAVRGFSHLSPRLANPAWQLQNPATVGLAQNPMANPSVKGTGLRPAPYVER